MFDLCGTSHSPTPKDAAYGLFEGWRHKWSVYITIGMATGRRGSPRSGGARGAARRCRGSQGHQQVGRSTTNAAAIRASRQAGAEAPCPLSCSRAARALGSLQGGGGGGPLPAASAAAVHAAAAVRRGAAVAGGGALHHGARGRNPRHRRCARIKELVPGGAGAFAPSAPACRLLPYMPAAAL